MKEVTLVFKSGAKASFTVEQFKTFKNSFGFLSGIEYEGATPTVPFHISVSNIDAIFVEDIGGKESTKEPDHQLKISMVVKLSKMIGILCLDRMPYLKGI